MSKPRTPAELLRDGRLANDQGLEWLKAGLGVGAVGLLGAVAGAVCPLCVVATPALLGAGLARSVWGRHLQKKAHEAVGNPTEQTG